MKFELGISVTTFRYIARMTQNLFAIVMPTYILQSLQNLSTFIILLQETISNKVNMTTRCWICDREIPEKRQKQSFGRPIQTGQICFCFNSGLLPKYDSIRPPVIACKECKGERRIPKPSVFNIITSFKICESCNGERIAR
jgi:hypothetical protein